MRLIRALLVLIYLHTTVCFADSLTFYTGESTELNDEAFKRLKVALNQLGHQANLKIVATRRTLQLANTIGDGELMRVPHLQALFPKLTDNLIMVESPLIQIEFVEISKKSALAPTSPAKGKIAILKDVFLLQQDFPHAIPISSYSKMFELLDAQRVEHIILPVSSQQAIISNPLYTDNLTIKTLKTQTLYTYLHKKHQLIAEQLSTILKND